MKKTVDLKVNHILREIENFLQSEETKSKHSSRPKSSSAISSASSVIMKQRAKAEAAKARLKFADEEAELS